MHSTHHSSSSGRAHDHHAQNAAFASSVREASIVLSGLSAEIGKAIIGQEKVVESLVRALLCNGHVLIEGVPGIAKTFLIKVLARASGCSVQRIQFTVDLLPSDIVGLTTFDPHHGFEIVKGPIFANFIIADEINRSPPKTQSAFLEAMQEKQVTIGKKTFALPLPFFVMANQNPLESEGVYNLPEAQLDRFLFKVLMDYPQREEERKIMAENMTFKNFEEYDIRAATSAHDLLTMQRMVHHIYLDDKIKSYILDIVARTRSKDFKYGDYVELGASPRASIATYIASKAQALIHGRTFVVPADVKTVVYDILRHRILLSFRAKAEKISPDMIIDELLQSVSLQEH